MGWDLKQLLFSKYFQPLLLRITDFAAANIKRYSLDDDAYNIFNRHGFNLLRKHYYRPIPDDEDIDESYWDRRSQLVGLEMNDPLSLKLLDDIFPRYLDEFRQEFPLYETDDKGSFHLINGSFMAIDAHVYYCFIRHFKPKRIIEIGAGNSTLVSVAAGRRNCKEGSPAQELIAIEPFPNSVLKAGVDGLSRLIEDKVQRVDLNLFTELERGDILFIDSTHVLREGGDVLYEYCEILPRLSPGVLVHVHDISLPKPYPRVYTKVHHYYWNEQYLLQAFLSFNSKFEVMWAGNYMMLKYAERLCSLFPEFQVMREVYPLSEPSSFWMRVKTGD